MPPFKGFRDLGGLLPILRVWGCHLELEFSKFGKFEFKEIWGPEVMVSLDGLEGLGIKGCRDLGVQALGLQV